MRRRRGVEQSFGQSSPTCRGPSFDITHADGPCMYESMEDVLEQGLSMKSIGHWND